jgi:rRNA maturation endonuclease Nob1
VELIVIAFFFGLSAGVIGKIKGSSFFERYEPKRRCPECNNVVPLHDQVCMRCGRDLDWPEPEKTANTPA